MLTFFFLCRAIITAEAALRKAQKMPTAAAAGTSWWLTRDLEESKKVPANNLQSNSSLFCPGLQYKPTKLIKKGDF